MSEYIITYFLVAATAGLIYGFIGSGIELILIPLLIWVLKAEGISHNVIIHLSIGTSAAAITIMGIVTTLIHHKKQAIHWHVLKKVLLGLKIGIILGSIVAKYTRPFITALVFALATLIYAVRIYRIFLVQPEKKLVVSAIKWRKVELSGVVIGFVAGLAGINAFTTYILRKLGLTVKQTVGTSVALTTSIAFGISIMYIIIGWNNPHLPSGSLGFVNWKLVWPMAISSTLFTFIGLAFTDKIPHKILRNAFCVLLVLVSMKMFYTAYEIFIHHTPTLMTPNHL